MLLSGIVAHNVKDVKHLSGSLTAASIGMVL
jgi:hypothetical protein